MVKDFDSRPWSDWKMLLATRLLMNRICRSTETISREAHLEPICLQRQKYQFESDKRYIDSCLRRNENIKLVLLGVSVWHYCMKDCGFVSRFHIQPDLEV